jgi:hypothetical protein
VYFFEGGVMSATKEPAQNEHTDVRSVTRHVYASLLDDEWPTAAGVEDFGIKSTEHYGALQYAVRYHSVTVEELDDALGNGPAITPLIRDGNPYRGVVFTTTWDRVMVSIMAWAGVIGERFPLGRLYATPATLEVIPRSEIAAALRRDAAEGCGPGGNIALRAEVPGVEDILSSHGSATGRDFCVVTEFDGSQTMVCLDGKF